MLKRRTNVTKAQRNPTPGQCRGCLSRCLGYCDKRARPGKLTCWYHQSAEDNAQKLFKQLNSPE